MIDWMRPQFSDIDEMDHTLIQNWNNVVRYCDRVYLLGDFCFARPERGLEILDQLNGVIYFINGNHDRHAKMYASKFVWMKDMFELSIKDDREDGTAFKQRMVLCHYPIESWNTKTYGTWHLHGHSHGKLTDRPGWLRIDVGVDCHDLTPISYDQVKSIMIDRKQQGKTE